MRFNKIGQTILLALSLTAIIVAMSCSGADATKPEDLKPDLSKELGSGRITVTNLTLEGNGGSGKSISVTTNFFSSVAAYNDGMGVSVTGILKVTRTNASGGKEDITGLATPVYNDAGGVYKINFSDSSVTTVTHVDIEYSYKIKLHPNRVSKTTPTKIGINTNSTALTNLNLYQEIAGSSEGSLFGKNYVIGISDINSQPTSFTNNTGLITTNMLTNLSISNGQVYKLWIY